MTAADSDVATAEPPYWLYLLECEGGVYYAGIALDVERRFFQHVFGLGAKFTRARPPLRVIAARAYESRSAALRAELQLKALPRSDKPGFFLTGVAVSREGAASYSKPVRRPTRRR